ncbi:MAG: phosphoribosylglycinamide formyltransferase [bacterium]|jgi:phosphoribosylglycinamide formyltransferase 1
MKNIAIFASGNGTNAERIIRYFQHNRNVNVPLVLSNRPDAGVLERAQKLGVKTIVFDRHTLHHTEEIISILRSHKIDLVVLAGFLWLVPQNLLDAFKNKIVNIHPALLPKYGGKGMYGYHVHEAVIQAGEEISGITIHYVNEKYDEGQIIFQKSLGVNPDETPESLAKKIHELEYEYYPKVIEEIIQ